MKQQSMPTMPEPTPRSHKANPSSNPQTKSMLNAGLMRAGNPEYADHAPNAGFQSAGTQRAGDNKYLDRPDAPIANSFESTGHTGAGSRKGTR